MATALDMERIKGWPVAGNDVPCAWPADAAPLERALLDSLRRTAPCAVLVDTIARTPQHGVDGDMIRGGTLDDGEVLIRAWRNPRCLVASRRQAALPGFAAACAVSQAADWPVAVRRSGGTAVVHRPGVLNVTLLAAQASSDKVAVGADYMMLLTVLRDMLSGVGITCDQGAVPGSHCDGRYNLRWRGRKLAGTAGLVARPAGRTLRIFHASLLVSGAIEEDLRAIHRFETALGEPKPYAIGAHIGVEHILGERCPFNDF